MNAMRILPCLLPLLLLLCFCGCEAAAAGGIDDPGGNPNGNPSGAGHSASDFAFTILPDTYYGGGTFSDYALVRSAADPSTYELHVYDASNLKAFYFSVDYNPGRLKYLRAEASEAWGPSSNYLALSLKGDPGYAEFGLILIEPDTKTGISGSDLVVARIDVTSP
jgi:hypothetical protein